MDKQEKAQQFLNRFFMAHSKAHPKGFIKRLDDENRGLHVILRRLTEAGGSLCAGDISDDLCMSTPRVAAALKTLEGKGYIVRTRDTDDKRKTVVSVTDEGRAAAKRDEQEIIELVMYLYDTVGDDDLNEFLRISSAIADALNNRIVKEV